MESLTGQLVDQDELFRVVLIGIWPSNFILVKPVDRSVIESHTTMSARRPAVTLESCGQQSVFWLHKTID